MIINHNSKMRFSKTCFVVINGSRKGMVKYGIRHIPRIPSRVVLVVDTTEEEVWTLKRDYSNTRSYYFYDPADLRLEGDKIYDIKCPNLSLYDDFINIEDKQ